MEDIKRKPDIETESFYLYMNYKNKYEGRLKIKDGI